MPTIEQNLFRRPPIDQVRLNANRDRVLDVGHVLVFSSHLCDVLFRVRQNSKCCLISFSWTERAASHWSLRFLVCWFVTSVSGILRTRELSKPMTRVPSCSPLRVAGPQRTRASGGRASAQRFSRLLLSRILLCGFR